MSSNPTPAPRSLIVRFCDAFLQEHNIKWMLAVGMLIVLGSSLFLVSSQWNHYDAFWKYLIFLAYTVVIFGAGQWTDRRLALPRTATGLQVLTVLLLPITFLVLHNVPVEISGLAGHLALVSLSLSFCALASGVIFQRFLRQNQPTFQVCFLMLSLAGTYVPKLSGAWAPLAALALWAVFAVGSVKVNRHVFWLTEERKAPRIFGFFPIMLLGGQFLLLFAMQLHHFTLEWLGFGCVLVALPILLAADAWVDVFQRRTGDLVRPIPWSISAPLCLGLLLCVIGVCLAATKMVPPNRPYALVPTATFAAIMMAGLARRTGKQAFVWAMLMCVMLAYYSSRAFFVGLVQELLHQSAQLVQEQRLPIAFYGLTFLPLLISVMTLTRLRWGGDLFTQPMRRFSIGLGCLMLAVSLGHAKALFPVALCMTAAFALQTAMYRNGRIAPLAIIAWLMAVRGLAPFLELVLGWPLPLFAEIYFLTVATGILMLAGTLVDAPISRLMPEADGRNWGNETLCQSASLLVTACLAGYWLLLSFVQTTSLEVWPISLMLTVFLFIHALRWANERLGGVAILFGHLEILSQALAHHAGIDTMVSLFTGLLLGQWLLGYLLDYFPYGKIAKTFGRVNYQICCYWLTLGLIGVYFPLYLLSVAKPLLPAVLAAQVEPILEIGLPFKVLITAWAFAAAWRSTQAIWTFLGCLSVLGLIGAEVVNQGGPQAWPWLLFAWAITGLAALPGIEWLHYRLKQLTIACTVLEGRDDVEANAVRAQQARMEILAMPITHVVLSVFILIGAGSLPAFSLPMRLAGAAALAGLMLMSYLRQQANIRIPALLVANLQVLSLTLLLVCPQLETLLDLVLMDKLPFCLPLALATSASLALWQYFDTSWRANCPQLVSRFLTGLRFLLALTIGFSLLKPSLEALDILLAASTFILAVATELYVACRHQREERVWTAELLVLAGLGYLAFFHVLPFGHNIAMFVVLGLGLLLWLIGQGAATHKHLAIFTLPFQQTAVVMPLATVGMGIYQHFNHTSSFLGASSLALLMAAAFYFWRGLEHGSNRYFILSGVVLNIALMLLWRELVFSDPQFFMIPIGLSILALVQLLRQEIPQRFHDPLRYLGALVILVSPTFHIVGGSWVHLFSMMVVSVGVMLLAIGLRVRVLMYTGTAFLLADLVAMLVRSSMDDTNILWIAGLGLGGAVVALAAYCERHRETLVQRMRVISEVLQEWQ